MVCQITIIYLHQIQLYICNKGSIATFGDAWFCRCRFYIFVFNEPYINSSHVITALTDNDVIESVLFFKEWKSSLNFSIRSGANSLGGYSKCAGCVTLNLNLMKEIEQIEGSDGNPYLTVQPGVNISQFVSWMGNSSENVDKLMVPHGDCPMVWCIYLYISMIYNNK